MSLFHCRLTKRLKLFRFFIFLLYLPAYWSHFATDVPLCILSAPNATLNNASSVGLSHFGFSLTAVTLNATEKWPTLIVGAPRTNNDEGAVYACSSSSDVINNQTTDACRRLAFKVDTSERSTLKQARIGASVCSAGHDQSVFAVCAPGYTTITPNQQRSGINYHAFDGLCQIHINRSLVVNYHKCPPSESTGENAVNDGTSNSSALPKSRGCLAGFSSTLTLSDNMLLFGVGMPGDGHSGSSYFFMNRFSLDGVFQDEKWFSVAMEDGNNMIGLSQSWSPKNLYVVPEISTFNRPHDALLYFLKTPPQQLNLDSDNNKLTNSINLRLNRKERPKSFEFFGFSLISLEGARADSEIFYVVGAPFARQENQEVGCVYLIDATKMHAKQYFGVERLARFGASLLNVGDVNEDGRHDFAVGCPFCGLGVGAVYLYTSIGNEGDAGYQLSQILRPSVTDTAIRGFGWSLAGHLDMNLDGTSDLVVGAPLSDKVFVFRGLPAVHVVNKDLSSLMVDIILKNYSQLRARNSSFKLVENWKLYLRFPKRISAFKSSRRYQVSFNPDAARATLVEKRLTIEKNPMELNATILSAGWQLLSGQVELIWRPEQFLRDLRSPLLLTANLRLLPEEDKPMVALLNADNQTLKQHNLLAPNCHCDSNDHCKGDLQLGRSQKKVVFVLSDWNPRVVHFGIKLSGVHQVWGAQLMLTLPKMFTLFDGMHLIMKGSTNEVKLELVGEMKTNGSSTLAFSLLYPAHAKPFFDPVEDRNFGTLKFQLRLDSTFQLRNQADAIQQVEIRVSKAVPPGALEFFNCGNWIDTNPSNDLLLLQLSIIRNASLWMSFDQSKGDVMHFDNRALGETLKGATQGVIAVNRIGPPLLTTWYLKMNGSTPVDGLVIELQVPIATQNGRRLLYIFKDLRQEDGQSLSTMPRLIHEFNSSLITNCDSSSLENIVNPLNLNAVVDKSYLLRDKVRHRRSVEDQQEEQRTISINTGVSSSKPVTLACGHKSLGIGLPQCALFRCKLPRAMDFRSNMQLRFDAWLWADTFLHSGLAHVRVHVGARVILPSTSPALEGIVVNETWVVGVIPYYFRHAKGTSVVRLTIWPIVLGVLVGILLLLIIIITLCRCGFFRRRRPELEYKSVSLHEDHHFYE